MSRDFTKGMSSEIAGFYCTLSAPTYSWDHMVLAPDIDTKIISSLPLRKLRLGY